MDVLGLNAFEESTPVGGKFKGLNLFVLVSGTSAKAAARCCCRWFVFFKFSLSSGAERGKSYADLPVRCDEDTAKRTSP